MEQRFFSINDTAKYLGLSPKTIYLWAEKGTMPAYKLGRVWRFDQKELDQFVRGTADLYGSGKVQAGHIQGGDIKKTSNRLLRDAKTISK